MKIVFDSGVLVAIIRKDLSLAIKPVHSIDDVDFDVILTKFKEIEDAIGEKEKEANT